jgi:prepilin-type N-terminal cleavage/methylation domain-containing protein
MRRQAQGFTLIEIMVVIAIIAGLIGTVAIIVPQMQEKQRRFTCQNNLSQLGGLFIAERTEKHGKPKYDGSALWLSWRQKRDQIKEGQEAVLICPGDNAITAPDTPELKQRYTDVDLKNPPNDLTSYAARDFSVYPLDNEAKRVQIIGCDRNGPDGRTAHHKNGLNIVYDDGASKFVERDELGISQDDPIVVGPESSNEDLKKVVGVKQKKD